ncbi:hypothetical protein VTK56DRAFT_6239 [Thermocarpiscus australiensis]
MAVCPSIVPSAVAPHKVPEEEFDYSASIPLLAPCYSVLQGTLRCVALWSNNLSQTGIKASPASAAKALHSMFVPFSPSYSVARQYSSTPAARLNIAAPQACRRCSSPACLRSGSHRIDGRGLFGPVTATFSSAAG